MNDTTQFTCSSCHKPFNGKAAMMPPGWEWHGSKLHCDDCCTGRMETCIRPPQASYSPTAIQLSSGAYIDLADPDFGVIQPEDIAAGLRQLRFSGQTRQPYTIAQHSCLVLLLIEPVAAGIGGQKGQELRRCALMHDAAEALLHDISQPLKSLLPDYRTIEATFEEGLERRFGYRMTGLQKWIIKMADLQALAIEQRDLLGHEHPWPCLQTINRSALCGISIKYAWGLPEAEAKFLASFHELFPANERIAA